MIHSFLKVFLCSYSKKSMAQNYCLLVYTLKVMIIYHTHTHTHMKKKAKINLHPQTQTWEKCYFKIFYNFFSDPETKISILMILECFLLLKLPPPRPQSQALGNIHWYYCLVVYSLVCKTTSYLLFLCQAWEKKVNAFVFLSHLGSYCFSRWGQKTQFISAFCFCYYPLCCSKLDNLL